MPKIVENYLDLSDCNLFESKIYTTKFCALLGKDKFNKKGDMLLQMFKVVSGDSFDEFYSYRGESAEKYVNELLTKNNVKHKWYGAETTTYDMFKNPVFGGNLDFAYKVGDNYTSLEVKSKNIKDFAFISKNGPNETHLYQAKLGAYLAKLKSVVIIYVFFNNEQEQKMRDAKACVEFAQGELKYLKFKINIDEEQIRNEMTEAYNYYSKCLKEKRIPLEDISKETLRKLGIEQEIDIFAQGIDL